VELGNNWNARPVHVIMKGELAQSCYMRFQSGTVQCNHILSVPKEKGETVMDLCDSDGEEVTARKVKQGKATIQECCQAMKEAERDKIRFPGFDKTSGVIHKVEIMRT
jgi:hypothetical protein